MERGTEHARKEAKEQVPGDRVKDAPAVARELRWRVRLANGYTSDDDMKHRRKPTTTTVSSVALPNGTTKKRKRGHEDGGLEEPHDTFMHFKPRTWDVIAAHPVQREEKILKAPKPALDATDWSKDWVEWTESPELPAGDSEVTDAMVEQRRDVIIKVRRTERGVERQRVERLLEEWVWTDGNPSLHERDIRPSSTEGHAGKAEPIDIAEVPAETNGTS